MDKVLTSLRELVTALVNDTTSPLYNDGTANTHGIRKVFKGDPQQIPKSDFPCVVVRPVSSSWAKRFTRYDRKEHLVEVIIVQNLQNYSDSNPEDPGIVQSVQDMIDMMEKTDTAEKTLGTTIIGKVSANPKLPYSSTVGEVTTTQYAAVDMRPESIDYVFNASRGFPTFEVIALFRVTSQGDRA